MTKFLLRFTGDKLFFRQDSSPAPFKLRVCAPVTNSNRHVEVLKLSKISLAVCAL